MKKDELIVTYGENVERMTADVLEAAGLADMIPRGARIGVKPNLVVARPCGEGATTSPVMTGALIAYLQAHGHRDVTILEGAWVGDSTSRAFKVCGYEEISKRYGVPLADTKRDSYTVKESGGMAMEISKTALSMDFLISLPVLKGHCQTKITGALKNLKGCISDAEKRRFHALGLTRPIAHLNAVLKTHFVLIDGMCGDLDFEEGGNPVCMNRIFCAADPVLADAYIAVTMGYEPREIGHVALAGQLGLGSADVSAAKITTLCKDDTRAKSSSSRKVRSLERYARQSEACSACYANLIHALARLEREGDLQKFAQTPVCIGQGYKGKTGEGVGVGKCTAGLSRTVGGCPPDAGRMLALLREIK